MSLFHLLFGNSPKSDKIKILSKSQYAQALKKGKQQLVDVRTAREFNTGHISGAKNFDLFSPSQFKNRFESLDKSKPVYIYCQSGNRSQKAAMKLIKMGFEEIIDLEGGYGRWKN